MRTTLSVDDDILSAAKHLAKCQRTSTGKVISALSRQGLQGSRADCAVRNCIPLLRADGPATPVTMTLVNQLRDEMP